MAPQYDNVGTAAMAVETWLRDVHSVQTVTVRIQSLPIWEGRGRQRKATSVRQTRCLIAREVLRLSHGSTAGTSNLRCSLQPAPVMLRCQRRGAEQPSDDAA